MINIVTFTDFLNLLLPSFNILQKFTTIFNALTISINLLYSLRWYFKIRLLIISVLFSFVYLTFVISLVLVRSIVNLYSYMSNEIFNNRVLWQLHGVIPLRPLPHTVRALKKSLMLATRF